MFIPSIDGNDTSYFMSRYIWNPEDEQVHGGSEFDDMTDTCSSGSLSNIQDEDVCEILTFFLKKKKKFLFISLCKELRWLTP